MKTEKDQFKISPTRLWKRLNEIEQEVKLGTFDNAILALMLFILAISVSYLISNLTSGFKTPIQLIIAFVLVLFLWQFLYLITGYVSSISSDKSRFFNKINVLSILAVIFIFLALVFIIPLGFEWLFPKINQHQFGVQVFMIIVVYSAPIISGILIRKKLINYFVKNFPNLFLRKINKMNVTGRKKALKRINKTLPELRKLCKEWG